MSDMRVIIITNEIKDAIINTTSIDSITNLIPIELTDGRLCIGADVLDDFSYIKYTQEISNLPIEVIDDLLIPDNKLRWLMERDNLLPLLPENYQTLVAYYKTKKEL